MNRVTAIIATTVILLTGVVVVTLLVAQGYQFDFHKRQLTPTGILVATSDPDGAAVYLNGELKTATNNSLNLTPGRYLVKIAKDGFTPWQKDITIKSKEVFKTNAFLFPSLPDLSPVTLNGAADPTLSPDGTKIAYQVASASAEKNGVWILDMGRIFGPDFRQVSSQTYTSLAWDPDSKQLLASSSAATYLLDTNQNNLQPAPLPAADTASLLAQWQAAAAAKSAAMTAKLPKTIAAALATSASTLRFSPDDSKILYQATASARLPLVLTSYLPGTDPTPQARNLTATNVYVYDIKEDRNYEISNCKFQISNCVWFPSSRHLLSYTDHEIAVTEYDGSNRAVIYAGPFVSPPAGGVFPWPNWSKIIILTSLNAPTGLGENLYSINLR